MGQDTELLMQRIEDIIIKSILATASGIVSGIKQFVKYPEACFGNFGFYYFLLKYKMVNIFSNFSKIIHFILELFGFDILIDDTLKPWLLEVNLTPSLGCDSPLDVRLKSALIADLLTLVGIPAIDPMLRPQSTQLNRSAVTSTKRIVNVSPLMRVLWLNNESRLNWY